MYADKITDSMRVASMRRSDAVNSEAYNEEHGITPKTIKKAVRDLISISKESGSRGMNLEKDPESMSRERTGEADRRSDRRR